MTGLHGCRLSKKIIDDDDDDATSAMHRRANIYYKGISTVFRTSSITSSTSNPSRYFRTASRVLPHCKLISSSGFVITTLCWYTLRAASLTREGVTKEMPCSGERIL